MLICEQKWTHHLWISILAEVKFAICSELNNLTFHLVNMSVMVLGQEQLQEWHPLPLPQKKVILSERGGDLYDAREGSTLPENILKREAFVFKF